MATYHWVFVESGRINKKIIFCFCRDNIYLRDTCDIAAAKHYEKLMIERGHTFKNSVDEIIEDFKAELEAPNPDRYIPKVDRMKLNEFNKEYKKQNDKQKQF